MMFRKTLLTLASVSFLAITHATPGIEITREATHQSSAVYTEVSVDMRVQTASGPLAVTRYFHDGEWVFFSQWSNLQPSSRKGRDGLPTKMMFNEWDYHKEGGSTVLYRFDQENIIVRSPNSDAKWRWQNTDGRWVDFNEAGQSIASGRFALTYFKIKRNADGDIISVLDQRDQTILTVEYHAPRQVKSITDYANRVVKYGYTDDNLTNITDVLGKNWGYTYRTGTVQSKPQSLITSRTEPSGRVLTIEYEQTKGGAQCLSGTNFERKYDATSNSWKTTYDKCTDFVQTEGVLLMRSIKDQLGTLKTFAYDYNPRNRTYTFVTRYPSGRITSRVMDLRGRVLKSTTNGRDTNRTVWLNNDRESISVNGRGKETVSKYDQWGNPRETVYPDGGIEKWEYKPNTNLVTKHTAQNAVVTTYKYNANGQQIEMVEAVDTDKQRTTIRAYDDFGQLESITVRDKDGNGKERTYSYLYEYDDYNNITKITYPDKAFVESRNYTSTGKAQLITDSKQNEVKLTYDNAGNALTHKHDGNTETFKHNAMGAEISFKPWQNYNYEVETGYNLRGYKKTFGLLGGKKAQLVYDNSNRERLNTSPSGKKISYEYDSSGNAKKMTQGEVVTEYNYDEEGQLQSYNFGRYAKHFKYDKQNRVEKVLSKSTSDPNIFFERLNGYNSKGYLSSETNEVGTKFSYTYDDDGRLTELSVNNQKQYTTTYEEENKTVTYLKALGEVIIQENFNEKGQKTAQTLHGETTKYEYDDDGRLAKIDYPTGFSKKLIYDSEGRLEKSFRLKSDLIIPNTEHSYHYDDRGLQDEQKSATVTYRQKYADNLTLTYSEVDFGVFKKRISYTYGDDNEIKSAT